MKIPLELFSSMTFIIRCTVDVSHAGRTVGIRWREGKGEICRQRRNNLLLFCFGQQGDFVVGPQQSCLVAESTRVQMQFWHNTQPEPVELLTREGFTETYVK